MSSSHENIKNDPPEEEEEEERKDTTTCLPSMKKETKPDPSLIIEGVHMDRRNEPKDLMTSFVCLGEAEVHDDDQKKPPPSLPSVKKETEREPSAITAEEYEDPPSDHGNINSTFVGPGEAKVHDDDQKKPPPSLASVEKETKPDPSVITAEEHADPPSDHGNINSTFVGPGEAAAHDDDQKKPAATIKPGAVSVAPVAFTSGSNHGTIGMSLRERREQQKIEEANLVHAGASSSLVANSSAGSSGAGGPDYKDQVRDTSSSYSSPSHAVASVPGAVSVAPGSSSVTRTKQDPLAPAQTSSSIISASSVGAETSSTISRPGAHSITSSMSSDPQQGPRAKYEMMEQNRSVTGSTTSSSAAAAAAEAEASSSLNESSQPGAHASNVSASMGARQKYEMMHISDQLEREEETKVMESFDEDEDDSSDYKFGAAESVRAKAAAVGTAAVIGAMEGSAEQQNGGPDFKDQVRNAQIHRAGPDEVLDGSSNGAEATDQSKMNSKSVKDADATKGGESHEPYSAEHVMASGGKLIEAQLVEESAPTESAIHVAVELHEEEPPRKTWKTISITVVLMLLVIGGVLGGVLGSQSSSSSEDEPRVVVLTSAPTEAPPVVFTACDNATSLELGDIVNATIGVNATILTDFPTCGTAVAVPEATGVWFNFKLGENDTSTGVSISTCTGDSSLEW